MFEQLHILTLFTSQINFALGLGEIPRHEEFIYNVIESFRYAPETGTSFSLHGVSPVLTFFVVDPWSLGIFLLSVTSLYALMMTYRKIPWVIILCTLGIFLGYGCSHDVRSLAMHTNADSLN